MSKNSDVQNKLKTRLGHVFANPALLDMALTHASLRSAARNNERLEFLGDRVLGLAVAAMLYDKFPDESEGALAKRHTGLVQQAALAVIARDIGLPDAIHLSDAERAAGGAEKDAILADALEAVLAAVFLDAGFAAAQGVAAALFTPHLESFSAPPEDPKSSLQEWAQSRGLALPMYEIAGQSGPDHAPLFRVSVRIDGFEAEEAEATSKRAAEKAAAVKLLAKIAEKA
ncbi:MAG TPA: ribonuclease III [Alphaproteobacteria bacterium]|nr:ribonuclease III [Alphaproteobacteria bacterium]